MTENSDSLSDLKSAPMAAMHQPEAVVPAPRLIRSSWGQNVVYWPSDDGAILGPRMHWWRIPQRLGSVFVDVQADQDLILRNGGGRCGSLEIAVSGITWRQRLSYPIWRTAIFLRDLAFLIEGHQPQQRHHP